MAAASRKPRVLLVHYWLVGMRGGEKVLEALCRMFPEADILTHVVDREQLSPLLKQHRILTTSISRLPWAKRHYQKYLPFMPQALEACDLTGYDLVISSESGPAKGVIVPPDTPHICYCHSPMRYIWDQYHAYKSSAGLLAGIAMPHIAHRLRQWDVTSAARVDHFVANSNHVANRVSKYWRRDASVIHPPVDIAAFSPVEPQERGDYYLWLGELAPYKRPDIAIDAFRQSGRKLKVIGGPDKAVAHLQKSAGTTVEFLGKTDFDTLRHHLSRCKALIFPGEEDFGIVPVEALASGRPVIGFNRGGVRDTVTDGQTGILYDDPSAAGLNAAIDRFETSGLDSCDTAAFTDAAANFTEDRFTKEMWSIVRSQTLPHGADWQ
ncbi:glycosyltransferase [Maricaulis salignorans]|uniref:Glycosyltransferase involved in cell wall bisynthesis n=1 Tax=Maricaulis salignorans TaxID=144026 RepID=A0A1G9LYP2_9PROT|nr:glycosyltransferase [Maricaulis salignorans]SDL66851.1 Glycosyltransferase involved in cell wall bisynthesis [Maricaulis salignorans]